MSQWFLEYSNPQPTNGASLSECGTVNVYISAASKAIRKRIPLHGKAVSLTLEMCKELTSRAVSLTA